VPSIQHELSDGRFQIIWTAVPIARPACQRSDLCEEFDGNFYFYSFYRNFYFMQLFLDNRSSNPPSNVVFNNYYVFLNMCNVEHQVENLRSLSHWAATSGADKTD